LLQEREVNVIAGAAACAVGAMTSLLLLVIMYTDTNTEAQNNKQNDQSLISSNVHYVHMAEIIIYSKLEIRSVERGNCPIATLYSLSAEFQRLMLL